MRTTTYHSHQSALLLIPQAQTQARWSLRWAAPRHSLLLSSDVSGIVGMSLLELADRLGSKGVRKGTRPGQRLCTLIALVDGSRWRCHGATAERRCIADGRGWADDVDDDVEGTQAHCLCFSFLGTVLDASRVADAGNLGRAHTFLCRRDCSAFRREIGKVGMH